MMSGFSGNRGSAFVMEGRNRAVSYPSERALLGPWSGRGGEPRTLLRYGLCYRVTIAGVRSFAGSHLVLGLFSGRNIEKLGRRMAG